MVMTHVLGWIYLAVNTQNPEASQLLINHASSKLGVEFIFHLYAFHIC